MAPLALAANDDHDLAYSLGASLGERLRQEMPGLQLDALVEGLKQSYQGQPLKLDKARMQAVLQQHEAQEGDAAVQKLQAAETRFMANERGRYGVHELTEGVLYSELQPGTGVQPKAGGKVQVRYVADCRMAQSSTRTRPPNGSTWIRLSKAGRSPCRTCTLAPSGAW